MRGLVLLLIVMLAGCTSTTGPDDVAPDLQAHADESVRGAAGTAQGADAAERGLRLPPVRVGDAVSYEVPADDGSYTVNYTVKGTEVTYDRDGVGHGTFAVGALGPIDSTSSDHTHEGFRVQHWRYVPGAPAMVASGQGTRSTGDEIGEHESWQLTIHDAASRLREQPLCGFFNQMQGNAMAPSDAMQLLPDFECVTATTWHDGGEYPFQWTGSGEAVGRSVEWFEDTTRRGDHIRLAFSSEIPYPVAIGYGEQTITMTAFQRGDGPSAPPEPGAPVALPPYEMVERGVAGPDDSGAPIPFTLSEAFSAAMESTSYRDVQEFMEAHPDARAFQAYSQAADDGAAWLPGSSSSVRLTWSATLVGGGESLHFCVERRPRDPVAGPVQDALGTGYSFGTGSSECGYSQGGGIPLAESLPGSMPDVVPLLSAWKHYHVLEWEGGGPDHWGFAYSCREPGCKEPNLSVWVGNSWSFHGEDRWAVDRLAFDPEDGKPAAVSGLEWLD